MISLSYSPKTALGRAPGHLNQTVPAPQKHRSETPPWCVESHIFADDALIYHFQMLDSDEMSWNIPRDAKRSIPTRILHALAGQ